MPNIELAKVMLEGLIAGMEMNSSIPVQLSELKLILKLLEGNQT